MATKNRIANGKLNGHSGGKSMGATSATICVASGSEDRMFDGNHLPVIGIRIIPLAAIVPYYSGEFPTPQYVDFDPKTRVIRVYDKDSKNPSRYFLTDDLDAVILSSHESRQMNDVWWVGPREIIAALREADAIAREHSLAVDNIISGFENNRIDASMVNWSKFKTLAPKL